MIALEVGRKSWSGKTGHKVFVKIIDKLRRRKISPALQRPALG
jgi:hypothetical protein